MKMGNVKNKKSQDVKFTMSLRDHAYCVNNGSIWQLHFFAWLLKILVSAPYPMGCTIIVSNANRISSEITKDTAFGPYP